MLRVDGVMGKADSLMLGLNTIAGGAAGGELNLMVKSIRELAEDFDKRSGALMADGRRTLSDISRAVNNFDRNPSRVIFGGSNNAAAAAAAAAPASRGGAAEGAERAEAAVGPPRPPNVVSACLGALSAVHELQVGKVLLIVGRDHAMLVRLSDAADESWSSALHGRPCALSRERVTSSTAPTSGERRNAAGCTFP